MTETKHCELRKISEGSRHETKNTRFVLILALMISYFAVRRYVYYEAGRNSASYMIIGGTIGIDADKQP